MHWHRGFSGIFAENNGSIHFRQFIKTGRCIFRIKMKASSTTRITSVQSPITINAPVFALKMLSKPSLSGYLGHQLECSDYAVILFLLGILFSSFTSAFSSFISFTSLALSEMVP